MEVMIVGRRSCAVRALRQALLVMLVDVVLATEAAAPVAQAAHWPPRTRRRRRLLDAPPAESGAAVTTTGCTGASAGLAADQCAAWGQFFDGTGGPNWTGAAKKCTKIDPCGCTFDTFGGVTCSWTGSSITGM
jgi:hypothetical protein